MTVDALSALKEGFLRLESDAAHLHIGWALFLEGEPPSVPELRAPVADRLERVPRCCTWGCTRSRRWFPTWSTWCTT